MRKQSGASTIQVVRDLDSAVTGLGTLFPPGANVKKFYDQSEIIAEARNSIFRDLLVGAGLAVLVLYFFLGSLRPTLIVAATRPITLLATLALMQMLGLGLNVITMSVLRFSFRRKWLILGSALLFLSLSGLSVFLGKMSLLPPVDEGAVLIEYVMPQGTSLSESNRIGNILERLALEEPDVHSVYRRTGSPESGYQIEGVNSGEIMIKLKPPGKRSRSAVEVMNALKKDYSRFGGVVFLYHQPTQEKIDESFSGLPTFFGVTIFGTDVNRLVSLGNEAKRSYYRPGEYGY